MATDIYGVAYGIKDADGILLGGFDMVNVQKNLSPDPSSGGQTSSDGSGVKKWVAVL